MSSPNTELTNKDKELQEYVGDVLYSIIRYGLEDGSLITKEHNLT